MGVLLCFLLDSHFAAYMAYRPTRRFESWLHVSDLRCLLVRILKFVRELIRQIYVHVSLTSVIWCLEGMRKRCKCHVDSAAGIWNPSLSVLALDCFLLFDYQLWPVFLWVIPLKHATSRAEATLCRQEGWNAPLIINESRPIQDVWLYYWNGVTAVDYFFIHAATRVPRLIFLFSNILSITAWSPRSYLRMRRRCELKRTWRLILTWIGKQ